jgi:putative endonuclease
MERLYYVYVLASRSRNLYVGVTNNLIRRVVEHREGHIPGFTQKYRIYRLVHVESFRDVRAAIAREKQVKSWRRSKKVALIEGLNPTWADMADKWAAPKGREKQIPRSARDDKPTRPLK